MRDVPPELIRTKSDEQAVKEGAWFDESKALKVKWWCENLCRLSKAPYNGQLIKLLPWQWEEVLRPIYGWYIEDEDGVIERRFRRAQLWCGKKNGHYPLAL